MKLKITDVCISLIYIVSYIFALTYIYYGYTYAYQWKIISSVPVFVIIVLCLVYFICRRYIQLEYVGILLFLMVVYELSVSATRNMFVIPNIFIDVIVWPLLFWVFLDYSKKGDMPKYVANIITIIGMTLVCALSTFVVAHQFRFGRSNGGAVFTTYLSFSFLPFVYLFCSKRASTVFCAIVAIIVVFMMKRAAFIIVIVGITLYYIIDSYVAGDRGKKAQRLLYAMCILLVLVLFGWYLIDTYNIGILSRLSNSIDDGGSGRTRIWELILDDYNNSTGREKLFGHGFHSVFYNLRPFGKARFAHDSFIETLYDYGIIGLILLMSFFCYLIKNAIMMVKSKSATASIMCYTMVSMIVLTAISYFFEESVLTIPHVMIWGICIGKFIREKQCSGFFREDKS